MSLNSESQIDTTLNNNKNSESYIYKRIPVESNEWYYKQIINDIKKNPNNRSFTIDNIPENQRATVQSLIDNSDIVDTEEIYQPTDKQKNDIIDLIRKSDALFTYRLSPLDLFGSIPDWEDKNSYSTHKLRYGNYKDQFIVYPEVQYIDGKLIDFTRPPYKEYTGIESAIKNSNYVVMPDEKSAEWFTKNYKDIDWTNELAFTIDSKIKQSVEENLWNHIYGITKNANLTAGILGSLYQESRFDHTRKNPNTNASGIAQLLGNKLKDYNSWLTKNNLKDTAENQITFVLEYLSDPNNDKWTSDYQRIKRVTSLPTITKRDNKKKKDIKFYVEPDGKTYLVEEYDEALKNYNPKWEKYSYTKFNSIDWNLESPEEAAEIYTNTFERPGDDVDMRTRKNAARYFYNKYVSRSYKSGGAMLKNMNYINIEISDKEYKVLIAKSEDEKIQGLSNVESMDSNEGLLFDYSNDLQNSLVFNTKEMDFPIDIVFINDDDEVVAVEYGDPKSDELIECIADSDEKLKYVLEVNANSGIQIGDELDFEEDEVSEDEIDRMYILGSDGKPQMDLIGGERIFSRKNSRNLIKLAKRASKSKKDSDYKRLGKTIFKYMYQQDTRPSEYVKSPQHA